jgi:ATP-dependent DNA helicase RecQ
MLGRREPVDRHHLGMGFDCMGLQPGLSDDGLDRAKEVLTRTFGFQEFRPGQAEILRSVLSGEDVLAVMPTGSGKSLCYQLPAALESGLTIVVSPLIALMRDQVMQLRALGIAAESLNSGNAFGENQAIERAVAERRLQLLYVAPERFAVPGMVDLLRTGGARLLAVDEAHCISQWGHDFRPEYLLLRDVAEALGNVQTIAVTATADEPTRQEIVRKLFRAEPSTFVRSFDRPNLYLAMRRKARAPKQVAEFVASHRGETGIVYCSSRKRTERLAEMLSLQGHRAIAYHAGLESAQRSLSQDEFVQTDAVVMVATIAFGMGIDKPDVRFVCHADMPQSIEAYYQEIGRAGRDGLPADTLTLWGEEDVELRRRQIADSGMSRERRNLELQKLEALVALCETPRCRRQTLLKAFGEASGPCGNCDICQGRYTLFQGKVEAQKVMSAVLRTSGRFFARHVSKILTGELTESIRRHAHDQLKTFGVGKERSDAEWRSIFRQLHAADLIGQDAADDGRWVVTETGRRVLKGEEDIILRGEPAQEERMAVPKARLGEGLTTSEQQLLASMKAERSRLAREGRVPAYTIFPDRTLIELVVRRPRTLAQMSAVHGIGEAKLARFGRIFLDIVDAHEV